MSKELKALEVFKTIRNSKGCLVGMLPEEDLDLIETTLKKGEKQLKTLKRMYGNLEKTLVKVNSEKEKYKKALKIIKGKGIKAVKYFTKYYLVDKNNNLLCEISKEEYELLKEVSK